VPLLRLRDDLGRELTFAQAPRRVVSLVPSDTHTLWAMGLAERLVGRTRFCDLREVAALPVVGGTKDIDVEAVVALAPELVIANQEENSRPALEALAQRGVKVFVSLLRRAEQVTAHLARLARMLDALEHPAVRELVRRGYHELAPPAEAPELADAPTVFVPIWLDPLMTCNADTFGSDLLARAGLRNAFADRLRLYPLAADLGKAEPVDATGRDVRYPRVSFAEVRARAPGLVLLPDEPYLFTDEDEQQIAAELPGVPVRRCSGRDLFWYGAWTLEALPRLRQLAGMSAAVAGAGAPA
jgi:ABC-type Fe3+-hydroxamate transport system substrate-binding protein